ncbi:hypothetical protein ACP70R_014929 [Stipagrostis hirtigluma subsp. patula]
MAAFARAPSSSFSAAPASSPEDPHGWLTSGLKPKAILGVLQRFILAVIFCFLFYYGLTRLRRLRKGLVSSWVGDSS